MENKLNKKSIKLLSSNMFFRAGKLITSIFLNIFLWKNTNDIKLVAIFNIVWLVSYNFFYTFFANIIKKSYRNLINFIAILGISITYFLLFSLGNKIIEYNVLFAISLGAFNGLYWIVYNNNEFDLTHFKNRGNYQGLKKTFKTIIAIIVPSLIGIIIGINYMGYGYELAFFTGFILFIFSLILGNTKITYNAKESKFSLIKTLKIIFQNKKLLKMIIIFFLLGFALSNNLIEIILPLLLYSYGIEEMKLGFLVSFFSIITIISSYIFGKFVNYKKYKISLTISSLIYIFFVFVLLFFPNYWFVILFSSILTLLFTFIDIPKSVYGANILESVKNYEKFKTEYIVIAGLSLSFGEMFAFLCIYFIGDFSVLGIKILFGLMAFAILLVMLLFNSLDEI